MAHKFKAFDETTFINDIENYVDRYHKIYQRFYYLEYDDEEQVKNKSKLHAIYHYVLNLANQSKKERGCYKKDLYRKLKDLKNSQIPSNYDHFTSVVKLMSRTTIQEVLIHGAKGEPKYKSRKFNPLLIDHLDILYAENPLMKYRQLHELLTEKAESERWWGVPSIHFIKRYLSNKKRQNELRAPRNGESHFRKTIGKQMHFTTPEFAGQLLEIDGSRLQIPYNNVEKKRIDFLTVFVILDVTSSAILGYSHGHFESSTVVSNAFKRFFNQHSFLPIQITRDGSSAFKKEFIFMEEFMTMRGVNFVVTSDPQGKPHVENFYKTFTSSLCTYHKACIGLGITSTHIDSRITDKKILKKLIGDRNKLCSYEELVYDVDFLMSKYSNMIFNGSESAKMKFDRKFELAQVTNLTSSDKIAMTGTYQSKAVSNCEFKIKHQGKTHYYIIPGTDGESLSEVLVAYNKDNLSEVHLYKDYFEFWQTLQLYEEIPFLASQRTSSQQERYIKELSSRRNRFKQLKKEVKDKEMRVLEASSSNPSFEVIRIHRNKEDEVNAQNEFTRSLLESEYIPVEENGSDFYPPTTEETPEPKDFKIEPFRKAK